MIKKIREIHELDGLGNGLGLVLAVGFYSNGKEYIDVYATSDFGTDTYIHSFDLNDIDRELEILRQFGFLFEIRGTDEEIISKYKGKEFDFFGENYYIQLNADGTYSYRLETTEKTLGAKCFSKQECSDIIDELNA